MGPTMGMAAPLFLVMWVVMMIAMMFPAAAPMIVTFHRVQAGRRQRGSGFVSTWVFVAGYLAVWTLAGAVAFAAAVAAEVVARNAGLTPATAARIGGALILLAGLYQLTPWKDVCLTQCRTPTMFIVTSWREGAGGALRMGALHGAYLIVNHGWQALCRATGHAFGMQTAMGRGFARALTFLAVVIGWVFFRAEDVDAAWRILRAMAGDAPFALSASLRAVTEQADILRWLDLVGIAVPSVAVPLALEVLLLCIVMGAPNTQQLLWRHYAALDAERVSAPRASRLQWTPGPLWLGMMVVAGAWALLGLSSVSEFLYFQF